MEQVRITASVSASCQTRRQALLKHTFYRIFGSKKHYMQRSIRLLTFFFAILISVACRDEQAAPAELYSSIPKTTVLFAETHNLMSTLEELKETAIFQEVDSVPALLAMSFDVKEAGALFSADSLSRFFEDHPTLITLAPSGANKFDLLFATAASPQWEQKLLNKLRQHYALKSFEYSQQQIVEISASESFYFCSINGLWLASSSRALVEESIRQIMSGYSLLQEPAFAKLHSTANKKEQANLYLNLQELSPWLRHLFPQGKTAFLKNLGQWVELDLELFNKELLLSGICIAPNADNWFLQAFNGQDPQTPTHATILPAGFSNVVSYHFENAEEWHRKYAAILTANGQETRLLDFKTQVQNTFEVAGDEALLFWVDNEVGVFQTTGGSNEGQTPFAFLKYRDKEEAVRALETVADAEFIEGYRGVIIKKIAVNNPHYPYFGSLFSGFGKPYYFEFGGYMLFSPNLAAIKGVINDYLAENTLVNQEAFEEFSSSLSSRAHVYACAASPAFLEVIKKALPEKEQKNFVEQLSHFKNFNYAAAQWVVENEAAYTNIALKHNPPKQEKVSRQWSAVLEAPALNAPQFVLNHNNRKQEVLVQDSNFKLYLIDRNGKILWTKALDGPILGNVTQVDVFKNNKLQLAFNTNNSVYLLDRLGRDVEHFPIKLKSAATAPMAVFDYSGSRSYRLLVPCGKQLLNFGVDGKPVNGWKHKAAEATLVSKPQHFSVQKKDIITTYDANGNMYFLARDGEVRYRSQKIEGLDSKLYLKEGSSLEKSGLLCADKEGKMVSISPNGGHERVWLDEAYPIEHFAYFDDRYVYTSGANLFNKSDEKPWQVSAEDNISIAPKLMIFRRNFYTAAYSKDAEQIALYNKNGELVEGFPVFAQGPFDMGSLNQNGTINLVAVMEDGTVVCYAIN
jgi:hypothetical protein